MNTTHVTTILANATTVSPGPDSGAFSNSGIQATLTGSGAISATIDIEVSNDGTYIVFDTITLSGNDSASGGTAIGAGWASVRANVKAIAGTSASVNVTAYKQ